MQAEIFQLFAQVDNHLDRARGGLGIGLALVKQLAALHGGSVEVSSAGPGKGSVFTVRLPVVAAAAGSGRTRPAVASRRRRSR